MPARESASQARQRRRAGQEHLALPQPVCRQVEQVPGPLVGQPGAGIKPAAQAETPRRITEVVVAVHLPDFGAVGMPCLFALQVTKQARGRIEVELTTDVGDHGAGDVNRIGQKGAEVPYGAKLDRKSKAVVSPALACDQRMVDVVEMKMACELLWRRLVDEAAVPLFLGLGEKFNRHGVSSKVRFARQPRTPAETS